MAERLLQVIDEGRRTATYKLALLLALLDACAANAGPTGAAPSSLHTREIARCVLRLYFPQARVFLSSTGDELRLRQITSKRSAVLGAVVRLHIAAQSAGMRTVDQVEEQLPGEYSRCLDEVERTFARYPLRRLQVIGNDHRPFLYEIDWGEAVSLRALHADGGGLIRFKPGASDDLMRYAPLIRPLIEVHWVRMVAAINGLDVEGSNVHDHLFGSERATFPTSLRLGLRELQDDRCFYCDQALGSRTEVDHFIPWSRSPNDAVENLVLTDTCNGHKRDHLASATHVERWAHRLEARSHDLRSIAATAGWSSALSRSLAVTRSSYFHLPSGTPLWLTAGSFVEEDPAGIAASLQPGG